MTRLLAVSLVLLPLPVSAQIPVSQLWNDLAQKRAALGSMRVEYEIASEVKTRDESQAARRSVTLDVAPGVWRQTSRSGSGEVIRIFDGKDTLDFEADGNEFTRGKPDKKNLTPLPEPYLFDAADWSKAKEKGRQPCGLSRDDHECVSIEVPLNRSVQMNPNTHHYDAATGAAAVLIDSVTGLILRKQVQLGVEAGLGANYVWQIDYVLKGYTVSPAADTSLFKLPSTDFKEVKELTPWDAERIVKSLAGKPAPALDVRDMNGRTISLAALKGRTVLLDFWTTWCPPCRADGPDLEKLHKKYGATQLAVVGVSVSEERAIVENFLKRNPKSYPVALTTENDMPRAYRIGLFPTYIVIDENGNVSAAVEGDKGFGSLRRLLKKSGMDVQ
ncbi:MAG: TlpA disulfide reductase family protein [Vicinamibacterales bacterium]